MQDILEKEKKEGSTSLSMGYHDSSDTSSDGESWLEDEEALQDEGVVVASGPRAVPRYVSVVARAVPQSCECSSMSSTYQDLHM